MLEDARSRVAGREDAFSTCLESVGWMGKDDEGKCLPLRCGRINDGHRMMRARR